MYENLSVRKHSNELKKIATSEKKKLIFHVVMILTLHFLILKRVNKYGIFCNNKINDKFLKTILPIPKTTLLLFRELISFRRVYIGVCPSNTR